MATHDTVYSNNNFHLQSTSSAIDKGMFMFIASNSGSNATTIQVARPSGIGGSTDPQHYFLSPTSYYQATADTIQIQGCGQVTITQMTGPPAQPSISFTPPCSWAIGAGIHFPWNGTKPDTGVYEYIP